MKLLLLSVALFSSTSIAANTGFNTDVERCASLLPKAKVYNVSLEYQIDTTPAVPVVNTSFGVEWSPEYEPSDADQEAAFQALEPFVLCMGKAFTGK